MVECTKCQFRQAALGSPYCPECDRSRWKLTSGVTFDQYYDRYLKGKSAFEVLLDADSVLLEYAYYHADPDLFTPILAGPFGGDYRGEHEPMEKLFIETFRRLFRQRLEAESGELLHERKLGPIAASFEKFHAGAQRLMAEGVATDATGRPGYMGISGAWQLILLVKKCSARAKADVGFIDALARQFDPGSALFMLELFVQLRGADKDRAFRRIASAIETDFLDLLREPVLLVTPWEHQAKAFARWRSRGRRGVVEMATATGKTLVGILAIEALYKTDRSATVRVLVHSTNILNQWRREVIEKLGLLEDEDAPYTVPIRIGEFSIHFNTVQSVSQAPEAYPADLLIADEVHHLASPEFRKALSIPKQQVLGLSAFIEGAPRTRILEKELGPTVYELDLASAQEKGILPSFRWLVRAVELDVEEKVEFAKLSKDIVARFSVVRDDWITIRKLGGKETEFEDLADFFRLVENARYRGQEIPQDWQILQGTVLKRRWLIHRSRPRMERAVELIIERARTNKVMVFAMTIESAETIARAVSESCDNVFVIHSKLKEDTFSIIKRFREVDHGVLIGVRMLEEGIDVPDADIGISVASSKTRLQLIQRMGRILRNTTGKSPVFVNFVAIPDASTYVDDEDHLGFLDDLAWIQETALRMNLDLEVLDPDDPIWRKASEAERAFARRYGGRSPDSIGKIGSFNIVTVLERFHGDPRNRLTGELARYGRNHRISDKEWTRIVRFAFDKPKGVPLNIPGYWWLLVLADRHPGALIRLFRPDFDDADLPEESSGEETPDSTAPADRAASHGSTVDGTAESTPTVEETEPSPNAGSDRYPSGNVPGIAKVEAPSARPPGPNLFRPTASRYAARSFHLGSRGSGNGRFYHPAGIASDAKGNIYIADGMNHRIQKFARSGHHLASWGCRGPGVGEFEHPSGVAVDEAGTVWVVDGGNARFLRFAANGKPLGTWGRYGTKDGELADPHGIAIDREGHVYVTDFGNHRIQKFGPDGVFLEKMDRDELGDALLRHPSGVAADPNGVLFVTDAGNNRIVTFGSGGTLPAFWGTPGNGDGQLRNPGGIAVDHDGFVYVADSGNDRIQKFGRDGTFLGLLTGYGSQLFRGPRAVAVDGSGSLLVADTKNDRLCMLVEPAFRTGADAGKPIGTVPEIPDKIFPAGMGDSAPKRIAAPTAAVPVSRALEPTPVPDALLKIDIVARWGGKGGLLGSFEYPSDVSVDRDGNLWIADTYNHRIQKFTAEGVPAFARGSKGTGRGEFEKPSGIAVDDRNMIYVADPWNSRILVFDCQGEWIKQWTIPNEAGWSYGCPAAIAVDDDGYVYAVDQDRHRILRISPEGVLIGGWGGRGSNCGEFSTPAGIAVDGMGNVYVADSGNDRIQKFTAEGDYIGQWGARGSAAGKFRSPQGVAVDDEGNVWVVDTFNYRVQVFSPEGAHLGSVSGRTGSGPNRFLMPSGIGTDRSGNIYVTDHGTHAVYKLGCARHSIVRGGQGNESATADARAPGTGVAASSGKNKGAGGAGPVYGDGTVSVFAEVDYPAAVAIGLDGIIFAIDKNNNRIIGFRPDGTVMRVWGMEGEGEGRFRKPWGLTVDREGNIIVADTGNNRIQKFRSNGTFIRSWGWSGKALGRFRFPVDVATDPKGAIWVVDRNNNRLQIISPNGGILGKVGGKGPNNKLFNHPSAIATDAEGNVFVVDDRRSRILKLSSDGAVVGEWGEYGDGKGQFDGPFGIAVDPAGNVWVSEIGNHRIQVFSHKGRYLATLNDLGAGHGHITSPRGLAADRDGNLYVADSGNGRILKIRTSGLAF